MFCVQETEPALIDPFTNNDKDPLNVNTQTDSSDDEPNAKRLKFTSPSLNLKVYQIPAFNTPKSLSIFPSTPTSTLPKFVNNPLNLANPLAFATSNLHSNNVVKNLHSRYSLPAKLTITPVTKMTNDGEIVRYKKNGEVAKKRGPPKGYKRKPKVEMSQSFTNGALLQAQNTILTSLLAATNTTLTSVVLPQVTPQPIETPSIKLPPGTELVEILLDPEDWFPTEPYRMVFSRKKNPKWKNFPYQCEHCFKGYRVASTLLSHAAERHGTVPRALAVPCPCCPHVSARRKAHKRHLATHEGRRRRIFCVYCLPPSSNRACRSQKWPLPPMDKCNQPRCSMHRGDFDPSEPYVKESVKYPFDKFPQYWYASEESLRLHKKRKHPYAAMFNHGWRGGWGETLTNS